MVTQKAIVNGFAKNWGFVRYIVGNDLMLECTSIYPKTTLCMYIAKIESQRVYLSHKTMDFACMCRCGFNKTKQAMTHDLAVFVLTTWTIIMYNHV